MDLNQFPCMVHLSPTSVGSVARLAVDPRLGCASPGAITLSASSAGSVYGSVQTELAEVGLLLGFIFRTYGRLCAFVPCAWIRLGRSLPPAPMIWGE
jgi:hypothetical protein